MPLLKRNQKKIKEKHKPEVVTGDFELHFEDVLNRNRFALVALFASGLVLIAAFVPTAVYHSVADTNSVSIEAEQGMVANPDLVSVEKDDITASGNSFIEFKLTKP